MMETMPRVDYDQIAVHYDERLRDHPADPHLRSFLENRHLSEQAVRVLDIGCGTGKQLASNRARYPELPLVGVDRSRGMLAIAQARCAGVPLVQADVTALPFPAGIFDYVSCQFAHAHFDDKAGWLREVARVLVHGGRFVQTNIDPWSMTDWFVYRYFPAALDRDYKDFVEHDALLAAMAAAGFGEIETIRDAQEQEWNVRDCVTYASSRHRASQFNVISDADYERGVADLKARAARTDLASTERFTFCTTTYIATRK
jgi:ubiquinone/menaquinone biosynthesis C-methylase UbiE